jgi:hypothetical protein
MDDDEEDEADPRMLMRLAIDDVRTAQAGLLGCLYELAVASELPPSLLYEQCVLVLADM